MCVTKICNFFRLGDSKLQQRVPLWTVWTNQKMFKLFQHYCSKCSNKLRALQVLYNTLVRLISKPGELGQEPKSLTFGADPRSGAWSQSISVLSHAWLLTHTLLFSVCWFKVKYNPSHEHRFGSCVIVKRLLHRFLWEKTVLASVLPISKNTKFYEKLNTLNDNCSPWNFLLEKVELFSWGRCFIHM